MYYESKCTSTPDFFFSKTEKKRRQTRNDGGHERSDSSNGWLRYEERMNRPCPAPDILYLNTYFETKKKLILPKINSSSVTSSTMKKPLRTNPYQEYRTIYDYIRQSIRTIEQQRNFKRENLSFRSQRPLNENQIYRRIGGDKRTSTKASISQSSAATTTTQTQSSLLHLDPKTRGNLMNYLNYSRIFNSTQSSVISQD